MRHSFGASFCQEDAWFPAGLSILSEGLPWKQGNGQRILIHLCSSLFVSQFWMAQVISHQLVAPLLKSPTRLVLPLTFVSKLTVVNCCFSCHWKLASSDSPHRPPWIWWYYDMVPRAEDSPHPNYFDPGRLFQQHSTCHFVQIEIHSMSWLCFTKLRRRHDRNLTK